jgi:hypothetical protein
VKHGLRMPDPTHRTATALASQPVARADIAMVPLPTPPHPSMVDMNHAHRRGPRLSIVRKAPSGHDALSGTFKFLAAPTPDRRV